MSWYDLFWAGAIIVGAIYLLYRSIWKKRGFCPGCDAHACSGGSSGQQPTFRRNKPGQPE